MSSGTVERPSLSRLQYLCLVFGERCFYCERPFPISQLTKDHVVPKSAGGSHEPRNQVPACQPCNQRKGSRMPTSDELARINAVWASSTKANERKVKKRHAPPCGVCHGNVATLPGRLCPACGRLPNGEYIVLDEFLEQHAS